MDLNLKNVLCAAIAVLFSLPGLCAQDSQAEVDRAQEVLKSLAWRRGPTTVTVGTNATFVVPAGYVFLNPADTKRMMELLENPSSGRESYFGPADLNWFGLFEYDETGHVPDDEEIDADAVLQSIRAATEAANRERAERGWQTMTVLGWKFPPFYDPATHRLDWAIDGASGSERVINYNTRMLGRTGVTSATLVASPETLDTAVPEFKNLVAGHKYTSGQSYAEYRQGDKVAEYGLAALVAGGTAAAVAKSGFGKAIGAFIAVFWKVIAAAGVAVAVGLRKLFRREKKA